jgi:phage N-6-adenine-methyltransferase
MPNELVTKSFAAQCLAFPDRVETMLAEIDTVAGAKDLLDKAATMQHYAERLKAGIELERPIALGVLKIKAKLGELMPAKPPQESGAMKGKGSKPALLPFSKPVIATYRKLAANRDALDDYYHAVDDVPSQNDFLKYVANGSIIATKHGNGVVDWYTPAKYLELCRSVMGSIDCDPATSKYAQKTVQAAVAYTEADNGLEQEWSGNVFLNPPFKMPEVALFVNKLCDSVEAKTVRQAILLTNNNTDTDWWQRAASLASAICLTDGRIKFYNAVGEESSPTNGQSFCYFGGRPARFRDAFSSTGIVLCRLK